MAGTDFSGQEVGAAGPKAWIDLGSTLGWPEDFQTKPSASVAEKRAAGWPGGLFSAFARPTSLATLLVDPVLTLL